MTGAYRWRMAGSRARRAGTSTLPVLALLAALVAAASHLMAQGALAVHSCVPGTGAGALGLRLALLRADAACPSGTLAVGGDQRQVIGVVVVVALPALAAHLVGAMLGLGIAARLHGVLSAAVAALGRRLRAPEPRGVPVRPHLPVDATVLRPRHACAVAMPLRRGPPDLRFA